MDPDSLIVGPRGTESRSIDHITVRNKGLIDTGFNLMHPSNNSRSHLTLVVRAANVSTCACMWACLRTNVYVFTYKFLHVRFYVYVFMCTLLPIRIRICIDMYVFTSAYAPTAGLRVRLGLCGPVHTHGPGRACARGRGVDTGFSTT